MADVRGDREQLGLAGLQESQVDEQAVVAPDVGEEPLVPIVPLDGGRAVAALHPAIWLLGLLMMVGIAVVSPNPILIIIVIVGALELWRRWRERGEAAEYYRLEVWQRVAVAVVYIGLIGVLALAVSATHVERDF